MPDEQPQTTETAGHGGALALAIKLGLVALLIALCFKVIAPFFLPVLWGVILSIALYSSFRRLSAWIRGYQKLASVIITLASLVLFIGPVGALAARLVENLQNVALRLQSGSLVIPDPPNAVADLPFIGQDLFNFWNLASTDLEWALYEETPKLQYVGGWLLDIAAGLGGGFLQFLLAILIAGLLLPNAASGRRAIYGFADKVLGDEGARLVNLAGATIRNVALGVMGVALLQALLSGLAFLAVDVPAAGLLAFLVLLFSALQVGPMIVVVPVTIYVFWDSWDENLLHAVLFTIYIVPVTFIDTVLRPVLVARGLNIPIFIIFIGVIGGTLSFGVVGLFVGPVALGIGYKLLAEWTYGEAYSGRHQAGIPVTRKEDH